MLKAIAAVFLFSIYIHLSLTCSLFKFQKNIGMAGIYIHIPFCRKACHYCNFHFSTSLQLKNDFVAALLKETVIQAPYLENKVVETIYFGGGTPSLLPVSDIHSFLNQIHAHYHVDSDCEITLETNPDDINSNRLREWKAIGINRLSIGIQSFFEEDLQWMNRAHTAVQAKNCIELAQKEGFRNITIDLIYGTPTLSDEKWKKNVKTAISLQVPHLSCYALTVEPNTALHKMIVQHKKEAVDSDKQASQFLMLMEWLSAASYEHYEISNFAQPGMRSRHNSAYWQGKPYLGLGPSAHSYNGSNRRWNVANNALYTQALQKNELLFEEEILTPTQQLNEFIMISLRTMEGINLSIVREKFGERYGIHLLDKSEGYIFTKKMIESQDFLRLTNEGRLLADGIAAALFV
jgi:oxygen-independent coproporphyrinogen III oxidase